jgi:small GTP-binding protein
MLEVSDVDMPVLKTIIVGSSCVGKTCLIQSFTQKQFNSQSPPTVTPAYACHELTRHDGVIVCLQVWDTAGQERYHSVSQLFYREADVAIICFEAGIQRSMESVPAWVKRVRAEVPECELVFVATKADLLPKEDLPSVLSDAKGTFGMFQPKAIFVTSSISREGIDELFAEIAELHKSKVELVSPVLQDAKVCC